jgi:hypothetical protein
MGRPRPGPRAFAGPPRPRARRALPQALRHACQSCQRGIGESATQGLRPAPLLERAAVAPSKHVAMFTWTCLALALMGLDAYYPRRGRNSMNLPVGRPGRR